MSDLDLDQLKNEPVPAPRPEARKAALSAAMQAFEQAENNSTPDPKEPIPFARPMRTSTENRRSSMIARHTYALAASVAVIAVGVPAAWHIMQTRSVREATPLIVAEPVTAKPDLAEVRAREKALADREAETKRKELDATVPPRTAEATGGIVAPSKPAVPELPQAAPPRLAAAPPPALSAVRTDRAPQPGAMGANREAVAKREALAGIANPDRIAPPVVEQGRDTFDATPPNPVKSVAQEPVSTFSIDVDTASYAFVRRAINAGRLPQKDAVRVEEMINYFPYDYPRPDTADAPFQPTVTVTPSPWNADNQLVHIAIKGYDLKRTDRPRANLVLLVDISGSMGPADRLPLLRNAFRMLVENLQADDTVSIVTYASGSDIRLAPTKVADKAKIIAAIDSLEAGGSTHGAAGIQDAYRVAEANFDKAAVNRVILATDGDWNVGITNRDELKSFIERKRETGIYLSILGVGMGNHNDRLMQALAQNGNGIAAYIDTLAEARKVLVEEASSSLFPIAKDVKIQFEFNPQRVSEYRLIGYETRALRREDFNNDKVDAGDVGSGHAVTAIYEITPVGAKRTVDELRYAKPAPAPADAPQSAKAASDELGFLKLRYKLPKEEASRLLTLAITPAMAKPTLAAAPEDVRFSIAVAGFGELLRGSPHLKAFGYDDVIALANGAKGADPFGYRAEMVSLVRLAKSANP